MRYSAKNERVGGVKRESLKLKSCWEAKLLKKEFLSSAKGPFEVCGNLKPSPVACSSNIKMLRDNQGKPRYVISSKYGLLQGPDRGEIESQRSQGHFQEHGYINLFSNNHQNSNICQ